MVGFSGDRASCICCGRLTHNKATSNASGIVYSICTICESRHEVFTQQLQTYTPTIDTKDFAPAPNDYWFSKWLRDEHGIHFPETAWKPGPK